MDDVWEDLSNEEYEKKMSNKELNNLQRKFETVGFKDGIELNVDNERQKGFEKGYKLGGESNLIKGEMLGLIECIKSKLKDQELSLVNISNFIEKDHDIKDILKSEYFKELKDICNSININLKFIEEKVVKN